MKSAPIKPCGWCGEDYIQTRFDKKTCSKKCSAALSHAKHSVGYKRNREKQKAKAVQEKIKLNCELQTYIDVKEFIFKMKSQHFTADAIDVFRLIDLFDRVFPSTQRVPSCNNIDKSVNIMFFKIVNWWRIVNGKEPLPTPNFSKIR